MERIIDRFDNYMDIRGLNDNQVTMACNLSVGLLGKSRKEGSDLSKKTIEKILKFYVEVNEEWLYHGIGNMLKTDIVTSAQMSMNELDFKKKLRETPLLYSQPSVPYEFVQAMIDERKRHDEMNSELVRQNGILVDILKNELADIKKDNAHQDKSVSDADATRSVI